MSHLMFLVHGSGKYTTDWSDKHQAKLNELARTYDTLKDGPEYTERVKIVPIRYDNVFDDLVKEWEDLGQGLEAHAEKHGLQLPKAIAVLSDQTLPADAKGFLWTHVLDPVLYRGTRELRDYVKTQVIVDVQSAINKHLEDHPDAQISFLSQSLGTIVTHDVLAHLGSGGEGDAWTSANFTQIANVFMLANASCLGPKGLVDPHPYDTVVRPSTAPKTADGLAPYCTRLYNFRNAWDPVPNFQLMEPREDWGRNCRDVVVRHMHQANVHGFLHYLEHPAVHCEIFRRTLPNPDDIPLSVMKARIDAFSDLPADGCGGAVSELKDQLNELPESVKEGDLDDFVLAMLNFYRAVTSAAKECAGLDLGWDPLL